MATMAAVMELGVAIRLADHEQWTGVIAHGMRYTLCAIIPLTS